MRLSHKWFVIANAWVIHCAGVMIFSIISINITFKTKWSPVYFYCLPFCAGRKASWMVTHAEMPHLTTGIDKLNEKFHPQSGDFCFLEKALTAFRLNAFNDPCYGHSAEWTALMVSFCPLAWSKRSQQFKLSRPWQPGVPHFFLPVIRFSIDALWLVHLYYLL